MVSSIPCFLQFSSKRTAFNAHRSCVSILLNASLSLSLSLPLSLNYQSQSSKKSLDLFLSNSPALLIYDIVNINWTQSSLFFIHSLHSLLVAGPGPGDKIQNISNEEHPLAIHVIYNRELCILLHTRGMLETGCWIQSRVETWRVHFFSFSRLKSTVFSKLIFNWNWNWKLELAEEYKWNDNNCRYSLFSFGRILEFLEFTTCDGLESRFLLSISTEWDFKKWVSEEKSARVPPFFIQSFRTSWMYYIPVRIGKRDRMFPFHTPFSIPFHTVQKML